MARGQKDHGHELRGDPVAPSGHARAPTPGRRGTPHATAVTIQQIRASLGTLALLLQTDQRYLGLFLRLEEELQAAELREAALARAQAYLPRKREPDVTPARRLSNDPAPRA